MPPKARSSDEEERRAEEKRVEHIVDLRCHFSDALIDFLAVEKPFTIARMCGVTMTVFSKWRRASDYRRIHGFDEEWPPTERLGPLTEMFECETRARGGYVFGGYVFEPDQGE